MGRRKTVAGDSAKTRAVMAKLTGGEKGKRRPAPQIPRGKKGK